MDWDAGSDCNGRSRVITGFWNIDEDWRRGWDLNPRYPLRYVRFRGGSFQPLTHLSATNQLSVSAVSNSRFLRLRSAQGRHDQGTEGPVRPAPDRRLTTISKERLQQFCAAAGQDSAAHLQRVVQLRMIQDLHH